MKTTQTNLNACKKCGTQRKVVNIENVPEPLRQGYKEMLKLFGGKIFYCEKCGDYTYVSSDFSF